MTVIVMIPHGGPHDSGRMRRFCRYQRVVMTVWLLWMVWFHCGSDNCVGSGVGSGLGNGGIDGSGRRCGVDAASVNKKQKTAKKRKPRATTTGGTSRSGRQHRFDVDIQTDGSFASADDGAEDMNCLPPCPVCASWENRCILPESHTPASAKFNGIFHYVNPSTGEHVYRNRSYEANPYPYHPRTINDAVDWSIEFRISELIMDVLRQSLLVEPELQRFINGQNSKEGGQRIDIDQLQGVEWQDAAHSLHQELGSIRSLSSRNDEHSHGSVCSHEFGGATDCDGLAKQLFQSRHRHVLLAALASHRFAIQQLRNFDIIYTVFMNKLAKLQGKHPTLIRQPRELKRTLSNQPLSGIRTDKCAIILDNRPSDTLVTAIRHMLWALSSGYKETLGWNMVIFVTAENELFLRTALLDYTNVDTVPVYFRRVKDLSWDKASALRASSAFYRALPEQCQRLLIFEDDAILRKNAESLEQFMDFASVGAPFRWCSEMWCR
jgi:hypothetical protein